jgi:hypothetical protein
MRSICLSPELPPCLVQAEAGLDPGPGTISIAMPVFRTVPLQAQERFPATVVAHCSDSKRLGMRSIRS